MAKWSADMGEPTVINGLRVVMGADGKKFRLCMNPMYPNLFMEIPPLKYESMLVVDHGDVPGRVARPTARPHGEQAESGGTAQLASPASSCDEHACSSRCCGLKMEGSGGPRAATWNSGR